MRRRQTDYGTIILHWLLVAAFGVAFVSGMRIATEAPERTWINWFDSFLPQNVWVIHMQAAVVLVTVSVAYTIYMLRSGLGRRIRLDKVRLRGLVGRGQARRGAANIVLYWIFFVTMLALMGSGGLMYFGYFAGYDMATLHWYGTWVILGFAGLHVLSQLGIGGTSQLLRIFRPTGLSAPPPQLDAVELLALLVEQSARLQPESELADKASPEAHVPPVPAAQRCRAAQGYCARPAGGTELSSPSRAGSGCKKTRAGNRGKKQTAKHDVAIQSLRRRRSGRHHRRIDHGRSRSDGCRPATDSPHQQCRCADPRRRHIRSSLAKHPAILPDHQPGRQF